MAKEKLKIAPVGEYILVSPLEEEETTASGLIVQSTSKAERPQKGLIIALGAGKLDDDGKRVAFNVEVGQKIMFKKYSPEDIELDGKKYLLMKEADILAVITE